MRRWWVQLVLAVLTAGVILVVATVAAAGVTRATADCGDAVAAPRRLSQDRDDCATTTYLRFRGAS